MKIFVTGTRGIVGIQGGVETHCEKLYPRLVDLGFDITVIQRSGYADKNYTSKEHKGVKLKNIYAPRIKSLEAILHTFFAIFYSFIKRAEVVHIHAIGPAILTPFARLLGMRVVVTHHGADYEREKWGRFAKWMLKFGEKIAVKYSNSLIVVSDVIYANLTERYGDIANMSVIYNGVEAPERMQTTNYLEEIGLKPYNYIFTLGRFVEEKGFQNLIEAYALTKSKENIKLVIAGDADHETQFSKQLKQQAKENNIVLTGFVRGNKLAELFTYCHSFILPSLHEGLPIALLEAMSYEKTILASNITANTFLIKDLHSLFEPKDIEMMSQKIDLILSVPTTSKKYDLSLFNWNIIASKVAKVYNTKAK